MHRQRTIVSSILLSLATMLAGALPVVAQEHSHSGMSAPQSVTAPTAQMQGIAFEVTTLGQSGITGTARLTPIAGDGDKVAVEVTLDGAGTGARPIHVHEGACADLNPDPEIPLTTVTYGASSTQVDASLQKLTSTPHAIFVHKSPEELPVFVACADLMVANVVAVVPATGEGDSDPGLGAALVGFGGILAALGYLIRRRAHGLRAG